MDSSKWLCTWIGPEFTMEPGRERGPSPVRLEFPAGTRVNESLLTTCGTVLTEEGSPGCVILIEIFIILIRFIVRVQRVAGIKKEISQAHREIGSPQRVSFSVSE